MTSSAFRRATAFKPLAVAAAVSAACSFQALAQTQADSSGAPAEVIITGSRFASDPSLMPIGATVITAADIRNAGVDNANEAIRKIGGVYGRQSFYGTQDFDLDLRGFGTNSSQNLVVLVDGVRLSDNELTAAPLSSIPIDSIERIEIMRGGSSVLYGDGATAGVIHIVTKRADGAGLGGSVMAEAGQYGHRALRASVMQAWQQFALDASIGAQRTDNYRDNNAVELNNFSGGAEWRFQDGRAALRVASARQDSRFAGALTLEQFEENPRQTVTPNDFGSVDTDRYTAFVERRFGAWEAAAELAHRDKTSRASYDFGSFGVSASRYDSRQTQFSPRLRHLSNTGAGTNELVMGIDLARWNRDTDSSFSQAEASQTSKAIYVRDELKWDKARIAAGLRHEKFDKESVDPAPFSTANYSQSPSLNAWELQGSYAFTPQLLAFAKAGKSYRMPNADENGFTPTAGVPLDAQTSRDLELGATLGDSTRKLTLRLFRYALRDEIFYDPTASGGFGANVNLDPTKRQGAELEADLRIARDFRLTAQWQHVKATFTDGPNAGNDMVMVPDNVVSARLHWLPANGHSANLGVQWVDSQRYGGDFDNSCSGRMPSYTTLDGRYAIRFGALELAVIGNNLTDKHYFSNAYGCNSGIYPNDGRSIKVSARYDF